MSRDSQPHHEVEPAIPNKEGEATEPTLTTRETETPTQKDLQDLTKILESIRINESSLEEIDFEAERAKPDLKEFREKVDYFKTEIASMNAQLASIKNPSWEDREKYNKKGQRHPDVQARIRAVNYAESCQKELDRRDPESLYKKLINAEKITKVPNHVRELIAESRKKLEDWEKKFGPAPKE